MTGFGQILSDLNRAGVRYVLVGGIALIRHGGCPSDAEHRRRIPKHLALH